MTRHYLPHLAYHLGDALSALCGLVLSPFIVHPMPRRAGCRDAFINGWHRGKEP